MDNLSTAPSTVLKRDHTLVAKPRELPMHATSTPAVELNERELAVLEVLHAYRGRVIARSELARRAGLRDVQPRRVDALLVNIRRATGDRLVNVRGRGWMLVATNLIDSSRDAIG